MSYAENIQKTANRIENVTLLSEITDLMDALDLVYLNSLDGIFLDFGGDGSDPFDLNSLDLETLF